MDPKAWWTWSAGPVISWGITANHVISFSFRSTISNNLESCNDNRANGHQCFSQYVIAMVSIMAEMCVSVFPRGWRIFFKTWVNKWEGLIHFIKVDFTNCEDSPFSMRRGMWLYAYRNTSRFNENVTHYIVHKAST